MDKKILVIGGTGTIGTSLVDLLQQNKVDYKVLVRSKHKIKKLHPNEMSIIEGDLQDSASVEAALAGIDTVFMLTNSTPELFDLQKGVIDLAIKTGVRKILRVSAVPADANSDLPLFNVHGKTDEYLIQSGLEYVILKPYYFMQNLLMHAPYIRENNMFAQYPGDAQIPMIDTRDIARASYHALVSDKFNNQVYELTGPRLINFNEVAEALSKAVKRNIQFVGLSYEAQEEGLKAAGLPEWNTTSALKAFKRWAETPDYTVNNNYEKITGTKGTEIETFMGDYASLF